MSGTPERPKVICREIQSDDSDAVVNFLAEVFENQPRDYWERAWTVLSQHTAPEGYPRFGFLLEAEGKVVGAILTIFTIDVAHGQEKVRGCTSSWSVQEEYRGYGMRLARAAIKFKNVMYVNPTPAPNTLRIMDALGFEKLCDGHMLALAWLNLDKERCRVEIFKTDSAAARQRLTPDEMRILSDHKRYGCVTLVCHAGDQAYPFVFSRRYMRNRIPYAQLIYCRNPGDLIRFAGAIGRFLARRGMLVVAVDASGSIPGLRGKYLEGRPKYWKGDAPPRLGDLAYTELALFGACDQR